MSTASEQDLNSVDLADHSVWDDGPPWELFAAMQRQPAPHFSPQSALPDEGGFWSITRHEDVRALTRDFKVFSSERRGILHVDDIGVPLDVQRLQMISMDPPRHDRMKALVSKAFTPDRVAEHENAIVQIISDVLDSVAERDRFDLVADVARPIPARVIGSLLGTPPEDDPTLVHWTNVFTAFEDPKVRDQWTDTQAVFTEIIEYVNAQMEERRESPRDDLVTAMMNAEVDGETLNELEIATFFVLLMSAGNDSTRATYSATMLALLRNPDQLALLRERPELIEATVEEGLRCFPAFAFMARAATEDFELHGETIKENDRVLLWYLASNRDESVFDDPHRFDITRDGLEDHQAFGGRGRHFCLGANLARLELKLWIEQTIERFPGLALDGDPTRVRALFLNQYNSIPVRRTGNGAIAPAPREAAPATARASAYREVETDLAVVRHETVADGVVELTLADPDGADLPEWTPGAHVDLVLRPDLVRQYSLCGSTSNRSEWVVGVLLDPESRGGSRFIHDELRQGTTVRTRGPRNHFGLVSSPRYQFVAGGIGITPMLPMIEAAQARGADWHLLYGGRERSSMAFLERLERFGDRVTVSPRDEREGRLDLASVLAEPRDDTAVYCCGPEGLLTAVEDGCGSWPEGSLHVERFSAKPLAEPSPDALDSFEVECRRSGVTVTVPAERSIYDVVEEAGVDVLGSCMEGVCGTCECDVIAGDADHRDSILSDAERAKGDMIMICVSRSRSERLVLDI